MNKPKPTVIIRETSPSGFTRQFMCADDAEASAVLHDIRTLSRRQPQEKRSTFYTGRIEWSEGYQ